MSIALWFVSFLARRQVFCAAGAGFFLMTAIASPPVKAEEIDAFFSGFSARHLDRGGIISQYKIEISKASGTHVISGDCMSACTLWLSYRHSCVEPDARLWFHAASRGMVANPWRDLDPAASEQVLHSYPPRLRAFLKAQGWMERPDYNTLSGRELAALGVPLCRGRIANSF
ncbi:MAG TPA: hypothetical protein VMJ31_01125 [Methylocystis sp.]|nr:hypothetical protein [Methylocystis sp.]